MPGTGARIRRARAALCPSLSIPNRFDSPSAPPSTISGSTFSISWARTPYLLPSGNPLSLNSAVLQLKVTPLIFKTLSKGDSKGGKGTGHLLSSKSPNLLRQRDHSSSSPQRKMTPYKLPAPNNPLGGPPVIATIETGIRVGRKQTAIMPLPNSGVPAQRQGARMQRNQLTQNPRGVDCTA